MAYKTRFLHGESYSSDDINQIFSRLTTGGVSLFKYIDGDNPLTQLNEAVSNFTNPGVEMYNADSCKVVYDNDSEKFIISKGNAFTKDGAIITVDSDGIDITEQVNAARGLDNSVYVCFYRNVLKNSIDICVDSDASIYDDEYSVKLAYINTDNLISDMRVYASTKLMPTTANIYQKIDLPGYKAYEEGSLVDTIKNIWSGANFVFGWGNLIPIQRIIDATAENVTYSEIYIQNIRYLIAFNCNGTDLQVFTKRGRTGYYTISPITVTIV